MRSCRLPHSPFVKISTRKVCQKWSPFRPAARSSSMTVTGRSPAAGIPLSSSRIAVQVVGKDQRFACTNRKQRFKSRKRGRSRDKCNGCFSSSRLGLLPLGRRRMTVGCVRKANVTEQLRAGRWLRSFWTREKPDSLFLKQCILYFCNTEQNNGSILKVLGTQGVRCSCYSGRWIGIGPTPVMYTQIILSCCASEGTMCHFIWRNYTLCF